MIEFGCGYLPLLRAKHLPLPPKSKVERHIVTQQFLRAIRLTFLHIWHGKHLSQGHHYLLPEHEEIMLVELKCLVAFALDVGIRAGFYSVRVLHLVVSHES